MYILFMAWKKTLTSTICYLIHVFLQEVTDLTLDLVRTAELAKAEGGDDGAAAAASTSGASTSAFTASSTVDPNSWKVGDKCIAPYSEDGQWVFWNCSIERKVGQQKHSDKAAHRTRIAQIRYLESQHGGLDPPKIVIMKNQDQIAS